MRKRESQHCITPLPLHTLLALQGPTMLHRSPCSGDVRQPHNPISDFVTDGLRTTPQFLSSQTPAPMTTQGGHPHAGANTGSNISPTRRPPALSLRLLCHSCQRRAGRSGVHWFRGACCAHALVPVGPCCTAVHVAVEIRDCALVEYGG